MVRTRLGFEASHLYVVRSGAVTLLDEAPAELADASSRPHMALPGRYVIFTGNLVRMPALAGGQPVHATFRFTDFVGDIFTSYTNIAGERLLPAESATSDQSDPAYDRDRFERMLLDFQELWDEEDEKGLEQLVGAFVREAGAPGIMALAPAGETGKLGSLHLVEMMRLLTLCTPEVYKKAVIWLLKYFLQHRLAPVREGALSGLLELEDKSAIPCLERAILTEPVTDLREEMRRGMDYLKSL